MTTDTETMTPERLAEVRQVLDALGVVPEATVRALLAEVEQRAEEIADLKRTAEFADEALREAREDRDDALRDAERARTVAANAEKTLGEQIDRAVAAEEERDRLRRSVAGWRTSYERLSRQLLRRHHAWQSAKQGRAKLRMELGIIFAALEHARVLTGRAEAERDRLAERLKLADSVCLLFGWSPSRDHTEREKALTMLWRRWAAAAPPGLLDPAKHPELSDEAVAELARQRDEIRARTLASLDGTEAS